MDSVENEAVPVASLVAEVVPVKVFADGASVTVTLGTAIAELVGDAHGHGGESRAGGRAGGGPFAKASVAGRGRGDDELARRRGHRP